MMVNCGVFQSKVVLGGFRSFAPHRTFRFSGGGANGRCCTFDTEGRKLPLGFAPETSAGKVCSGSSYLARKLGPPWPLVIKSFFGPGPILEKWVSLLAGCTRALVCEAILGLLFENCSRGGIPCAEVTTSISSNATKYTKTHLPNCVSGVAIVSPRNKFRLCVFWACRVTI